MKLNYKPAFTISNLYEIISPFLSLFAFFVGVISFVIAVVYLSISLQRDITKPEEVKNVYRTKLAIKKKNGLIDTLIINSNEKPEIHQLDLRKDIVKIYEHGENIIGCNINCESSFENVDTLFIIK